MTTPTQITTQLAAARSRGYLPLFKRAARKWNVPLALLLAVASRETMIGSDSYYQGNSFTGRDGHGKGIMQIDDRWHTFAQITSPTDHEGYINYGAKYLRELLDQFGSTKEALVAYNAGPDDVYKARAAGVDPDRYTTGGDYAQDVLQRAEMIKSELGLGFNMATMVPATLLLLGGSTYLYYQINDRTLPTKFLTAKN